MIFVPFVLLATFMNESVYARSLQATADKLGQGLSKIAIALGVAGFAVAAILVIMGKPNALERATQVFIGVVIAIGADSFIQFATSIA